MAELSIVPCEDYAPDHCRAALSQALAPLGGLDWVQPGMRIGIKANLVSFLRPEAAGTTHPALLCALTALLRERGAEVVVGDSPGGLYTAAYVNRIYSVTGMKQVQACGAQLNSNFRVAEAHFPAAYRAKHFSYTAYLDDCDAIINFCKLKTHGMMGLSAAAKNLFGVVPGTMKPEYHFRYPDPMDFAHMIVDLNAYFQPRLQIVDAVEGMEGNGPTSGTPRHIGCVIAGHSPHQVDLLCTTLIGLPAERVPTLRAARERQLVPERVEELELEGDWRSFVVPDYQILPGHRDTQFRPQNGGAWGRFSAWVIRTALEAEPALQKKACVGCAVCQKVCPADAIAMEQGKPRIDRHKCIRCFCCQEFCPHGAMVVRRTPIARLLSK
jgi:uncharacterized protein (DUF362 family)/Pyruvate/2-oxoacid:ferredoxin oxidoreductase delta subunit